jgi:hypothetical protein
MTKEIKRAALVEYVARRMLSDMEDHGGVEEFCEKLMGFPEQYLTDLASGAVDCIDLSQCLHPRVQ